MTEEEAINYLKSEGYDLFHVEDKPLKIIIAGCRNEPRGKQYKLEDGKLFERSGYKGLEEKWEEQQDIEEKLNSIKNTEE